MRTLRPARSPDPPNRHAAWRTRHSQFRNHSNLTATFSLDLLAQAARLAAGPDEDQCPVETFSAAQRTQKMMGPQRPQSTEPHEGPGSPGEQPAPRNTADELQGEPKQQHNAESERACRKPILTVHASSGKQCFPGV